MLNNGLCLQFTQISGCAFPKIYNWIQFQQTSQRIRIPDPTLREVATTDVVTNFLL
ncbi:hypothetical protein Cal6303_3506 [Calothrix sp. PCC 6303]|nr:hypothetical protein Cal6303_3506 [Calothrix sp. PCC 6303]